ncbi:MAG: hypothetical protein AB7W16_16385 [Candidatus Obscuribacterales bacterium]
MKVVLKRTSRGSLLAESVVAIAVMLPVTILTVLIALEASHAFILSRGMTEGAVIAARALSYEYKTNKSVVTDSDAQQAIFSNIRMANLIHDNSQIQIVNWQLTDEPKTVTVKVTYIPGAGTPPLPPFPTVPCIDLPGSYRICQFVTYRLKE